jgi:hypothetical protein
MAGHAHRELQRLHLRLEKEGLHVRVTRDNHLVVTNKETGVRRMLTSSRTDIRAERNNKARLRQLRATQ